MQTFLLFATIIIAVILMVLAISKLKMHPFIVMLVIAMVVGLFWGIVDPESGLTPTEVVNQIKNGFGSIMTSIGIVILCGTIIGTILEKTGAALTMANAILKLVGVKNSVVAMGAMGYVTGIPVFCDSGFVILDPIRKALVKRTGSSSVAATVALSAGLYISHVFIPPTPGPIAAANTLGIGDNLLLVIGLGVLCSIFPLAAGLVYAKFIGKKIKSADEIVSSDEVVKTYEELVAAYGQLPGGFNALAPIIIPVILMALGTIGKQLGVTGFALDLLSFLGTPIIALAAGTIFAIAQLAIAKKMDQFYAITNDTLKTVGPILFVTAAGGVLGKVISSTSMVSYITENAGFLMNLGIFFPFLLAAILKTAQGSSTVAITTTAGIMAPMMASLGLDTPALGALTVMAIGAGAMTVSHANDSYFWVVTNFGEMTPDQGYKTQTVLTLVMGVASIIGIFVLSLFF